MAKIWTQRRLIAVVAVVAFVVVVASEAVQNCIEDYKYHYRVDHPEGLSIVGFALGAGWPCLGAFLHENGDVLVALFTLGLVAVTGILSYYTYQLWHDAKESASKQAELTNRAVEEATRSADAAVNTATIMGQTAERQLRAYLSVIPHIVKHTVQGMQHEFVFQAEITNRGQTPAYRLVVGGDAKVLPVPFPEDTVCDRTPSVAYLAPTQHKILMPDAVTRIPVADVSRLTTGKAERLYFYGEVLYQDAFRKRWHQRFSYSIMFDAPNGNFFLADTGSNLWGSERSVGGQPTPDESDWNDGSEGTRDEPRDSA